MEEEDLGDKDKSDTEVLNECERELEEIMREKRRRESEGSSEEGFITVDRRNPKKLIRSDSGNMNYNNVMETQEEIELEGDKTEVCLFSTQVLPKQMALARLLKNEGIKNICKIKYKSAYRLFILFSEKQQAQKLIDSQKLAELDIRAQFTDHSSLSYGIIRGVDLDMSEKEILENLNAPCDIISAKRMKRLNFENKWIDSETIRLCFKSGSIPRVIEAYGINFVVEKFVFPVTQCSACWKFGHIRKFCSLNKVFCPKCGGEHNNCETEEFRCINCKGPHMALNKTCPFFIKEKEIRRIMSEKDMTYKKALEFYLHNNKKNEPQLNKTRSGFHSLITVTTPSNANQDERTYSQILQTTSKTHKTKEKEEPSTSKNVSTPSSTPKKNRNKKSKQKEKNSENIPMQSENEESEYSEIRIETTEETTKKREKKFDLWNLILKLKNIILSQDNFENKIISVLKTVIDEFKTVVLNLFSSEDLVERLFKTFNG